MKLSTLLEGSGIAIPKNLRECEIVDIRTDTASVTKESASSTLFVCIKGARHDTHNDIDKLIKLGVGAIVTERPICARDRKNVTVINVSNTRKALALLYSTFLGHPEREMKLVGITGTKGKTTVCYMLASICRAAGEKWGIIGTNGIIFGDKSRETQNTTPSSPELFTALRDMADFGGRYVFCEVTSQALKQHRAYGIDFDVGVFTNIYPDQIGRNEHENLTEYRECKSRLFGQTKLAVLNGEDGEFGFFDNVCKERGITVIPFYPSCSEKGISEALCMPGEYNFANAVCAYSVAKALGFSESDILNGLSTVCVPGRCENVDNPEGVRIVIDYAHEGEGLARVLTALRKECEGRLICVFGAGGDRSPLRRHGMGKAAVNHADFSVVTNDNPRNEPPMAIIDDILKGMRGNEDRYTVIPDRKEAIKYALGIAREGDTVLLAGTGAQKFEEICGKRFPLDERDIVSEYYSTMNFPK